MEFYLFRHGETDWNLTGRMQGSADIPLNALGREQAAALIPFFDSVIKSSPDPFSDRAELVRSIISSPLGRARETAQIAFRLSDLEAKQIRLEPRWAETHLGQAEGLNRDELAGKFGEQAWLDWISLGEESWHAKFPGGETKGEVRDRALAVLGELVQEGRKIWFVATHGGLLRRLLHHHHPELTVPIDVTNGSVFKFEFRNGVWSVKLEPVFVPA